MAALILAEIFALGIIFFLGAMAYGEHSWSKSTGAIPSKTGTSP